MTQSKRVVVTGGAGFIGSELVTQLAARGHEVVVVDNLANGKRENLAHTDPERVRLEVADIRDLGKIGGLLHGVSVIYHLACLGVRHSLHDPAENNAVNATATLQLLDLARRSGVERFVYVSSSEVYGTARWAPMTEEHPTFPMTVYGAGKLAGECYARAYHESFGFPTVVVRPFNSFGPRSHHEGDSGEVIPKFMLRAMAGKPLIVFGDGTQTRDFTYVADTARGIMMAGFSEPAVGRTINLGQGSEITINGLAEMIGSVTGSNRLQLLYDEPRPGDVLRLFADSTLARDLIGFVPEVSMRDGLEQLHRWYRAQGPSPETLLADEQVYNWRGKAA